MSSYLVPRWDAPANIKAVITTRQGGFSCGHFNSFNLASHVEDSPAAVEQNRAKLAFDCALQSQPHWLDQIHSTQVVDLDDRPQPGARGDAAITTLTGVPCVVLTADCLPVLLCARDGEQVAAAHAGWRGLSSGILRNTVNSMTATGDDLLAYLGPAISKAHFEIGEEVRDHFVRNAMGAEHAVKILDCFTAGPAEGKLFADLYALARLELALIGVTRVFGGDYCTYDDAERFYSYRRDGETGRMASVIWKS